MLTAAIVEKGALRSTPAGLPAIDVNLKHETEMHRDGQPRKVALELRARAIGTVATQLSSAPLGALMSFDGFLGSGRNGRGIVFHVDAFASAPVSSSAPASN